MEIRHPGVYVREVDAFPASIIWQETAVTGFVDVFDSGPLNEPTLITSLGAFEATFGSLNKDSRASYGIFQFFLNGGSQAWVIRVDGTPGEAIAPRTLIGTEGDSAMDVPATGMYTFASAGDGTDIAIDLLCMPAMTAFDLVAWEGAYAQAATFCELHGVFFIVDPPESIVPTSNDPAEITAAVAWIQNLSGTSANTAVYLPRIKIADPATSTETTTEASGSVAGIYAHTDGTQGVWKAPAGISAGIRGALGPTVLFTDDTNGAMNPVGLNAIREFPGKGTVVWGARTMGGSRGNWRYVSERRLGLSIERSVKRDSGWAVFEPNNEALWSKLRLQIDVLMSDLWRQGAFVGTTQADSYDVRCDRTTTTQSDIDQGIVIVQIGFAPLRPAEFVVLRIALAAGPA